MIAAAAAGRLHLSRPCLRLLLIRRCNSSEGGAAGGDGAADKTTVTILNRETSLLLVDSYSVSGFRLNNDMKAFGPIALFPTCVLAWTGIRGPQDVNVASMSIFALLHPRPDVVIVGAGDSGGASAIGDANYRRLRAAGLNVEILSTEHAVSTYNYLAAEGRAVGAALIPPDTVRRFSDTDLHLTKTKHRKDIFLDERESNYFSPVEGLVPREADPFQKERPAGNVRYKALVIDKNAKLQKREKKKKKGDK